MIDCYQPIVNTKSQIPCTTYVYISRTNPLLTQNLRFDVRRTCIYHVKVIGRYKVRITYTHVRCATEADK